MQGPKEKYNAKTVLNKLEAMIERGCSREIRQVYDDLSTFDWWPESMTAMYVSESALLVVQMECGPTKKKVK